MKIGHIDLDRKVMIVAEVGNNHEGSFGLAEEMIGLAAESGADAVKFQTIVPELLVSADQVERMTQLKRFSLSFDEFERLAEVAKSENVLFLSTPFDIESVRLLDPLVPAFKIASGDNRFFPLLREVAKTAKPILLSTGFLDLEDTARSKDFIFRVWKEIGIKQELAVLHCVSCYPTPASDANLLAIRVLQSLGTTVGYSDHTLGTEAAVLAVALGARIIEKHFTINKKHSDFRDHQLSADPDELAELVQRVKMTVEMLGSGEKKPAGCEEAAKEAVQRSIAAKFDLEKGVCLEWDHLSWVRPGNGLAPGREQEIIGRVLRRPLSRGELILPQDIELEGS
jgi:N,N'-diacetyllegionaminate synthase